MAGPLLESSTGRCLDATCSGAGCSAVAAGAAVTVTYAVTTTKRNVRIRPYLGTDAQNVGADLAAQYPGKISSTDRFAGIALAVVDFIFDPDVFPQSFPAVAPVFRGAKCYDPRTTTTVWTENPALHALHYARWAGGWALRTGDVVMADVSAAATVCDTSTTYTLTATGGGTSTVTLPRYRCGITITADTDHAQAMGSIIETMAGREGWAGGVWRLRAGTLGSTVAAIDETWLGSAVAAGGEPGTDPVISAVQAYPREQRINRVSGNAVDPAQRYQLLPYPAVSDAVLIAAKGERPSEQDYPGCNHIAHAQHLASIAIREAQAGLRVQAVCGVQAVPLELFDVVTLTHARSGMAAKTMEVVGWSWGPGQPVSLRLAEITAALFTPAALLTGRDPAPDSTLRRPWTVETLGTLTVTSGTAALTDGSIITRTRVAWPAVAGENVRQGGDVEVQYTPAGAALPAGDWPSWPEAGTATSATIPGLLAGSHYLIRARAVQKSPLVRGAWSGPVLHLVAAKRGPTVFRQTGAPSGDVQNGDEWVDTDDGNRRDLREAGAWVAMDVGTGGLSANATYDTTFDEYDFAGGGSGTGLEVQRTLTVTPAASGLCEFNSVFNSTNVVVDSGNQVYWRVTPAGGSALSLGGPALSTTANQVLSVNQAFSVTGGVALTFELMTNRPGGNPAMALGKFFTRITVLKR